MKRNNKSQAQFGLKCVLLSLSLLFTSGTFVYEYLSGGNFDLIVTVLRLLSVLFIILVLVSEIRNYVKLANEGVRAIYKEKNLEVDKVVKFNRLIEHNEFVYNFQPIVDAKSGQIYAYEILMRSKSDIGLNPHEILKYAEISNMLYTIEKCTFFNALGIYKENMDKFEGKKIFINSIPSVVLNDEDLKRLREQFAGISENVVIEILESAADDEDTVEAFEQLRKILNCQIAIDDYGSGYSNDIKLINNNPNYIKIDISLITSIDTDLKKQLLVANLIKFAKKYNIKILAEGVETKEELAKLIELGVDLIQGFYTARPNESVVSNIKTDVSSFIIGENLRLSKYDNDQGVYEVMDGDTVNLFDIALEKYTYLHILGGNVKIIGKENHTIDMVIRFADNIKTNITFENVNIKGSNETTVQLGDNNLVNLTLVGKNTLVKEGIYVPDSSTLNVIGDGNLTIKCNRNNGVGIGANNDKPCGDIIFDISDKLLIDSSGDKVVGIGGCNGETKSLIKFVRGSFDIKARGISAIGIGNINGDVDIHIEEAANVNVQCIGNEGVAIGSFGGRINVVNYGSVSVTTDGEKAVGIGSFHGDGFIDIMGGMINAVIHSDNGTVIGAVLGDLKVNIMSDVKIYAEGSLVTGIGSTEGNGEVNFSGGNTLVELLSAEPLWLGGENTKSVASGGNIVFGKDGFGKDAVVNITNAYGEKLIPNVIEGDRFEKRIPSQNGEYVYTASKSEWINKLCVFIPENCAVQEV